MKYIRLTLTIFLLVSEAFVLQKKTFNTKLALSKKPNSPSHLQHIDNFYNQGFYTINATIGTPGKAMRFLSKSTVSAQSFILRLDMSSSNIWVGKCTESNCNPKSGHHRFDAFNSLSFSNTNEDIHLKYQFGPLSGKIGSDSVSFGGILILNQEFGLMDNIPGAYELHPFDGYIGLGLPGSGKMTSPLESAKNFLDKPMFTTYLGDQSTDDGEISFGSSVPLRCSAPFPFVPLASSSQWQFTVSGFSIGSSKSPTPFNAISDISTFGIGVPLKVLKSIVLETHAIYQPSIQMFTVSCHRIEKLPDVVLNIGQQHYAIPAKNYVIDLIGFKPNVCALVFFSSRGEDWILGNVFSRSVCISYNFEEKKIGFGRHRHY